MEQGRPDICGCLWCFIRQARCNLVWCSCWSVIRLPRSRQPRGSLQRNLRLVAMQEGPRGDAGCRMSTSSRAASPERLREPIGPQLQVGQLGSEPAAKIPNEAQGLKPLPSSLCQPQMITDYTGSVLMASLTTSLPNPTASSAPPRSSVK